MSSTAVNALVDAKTARPEVSRALYLPAAAMGGDAIVKVESARSAKAVLAMLLTAKDVQFTHPEVVSQVLVTSVIGPTQAAIDADGGAQMCVSYAKEMSSPKARFVMAQMKRDRD